MQNVGKKYYSQGTVVGLCMKGKSGMPEKNGGGDSQGGDHSMVGRRCACPAEHTIITYHSIKKVMLPCFEIRIKSEFLLSVKAEAHEEPEMHIYFKSIPSHFQKKIQGDE